MIRDFLEHISSKINSNHISITVSASRYEQIKYEYILANRGNCTGKERKYIRGVPLFFSIHMNGFDFALSNNGRPEYYTFKHEKL